MDEKDEFQEEFFEAAMAEGIARDYAPNYYNLLFELATGLVSRGDDDLLVLGISGAQGTGKSTFAKMLAVVLERVFEKSSLVMSLDDFYYTRAERVALAERVHPMLRTRGVPGTHDVALLRKVIEDLRAGGSTQIPVFDKAQDDRAGTVPVMGQDLDFLVIEGWCWGALPAAARDLQTPVNALEAEQDPDGTWRRYVNEQLAHGGYQEVFKLANVCFYLAAPDFETVLEWRWQQEERLSKRASGQGVMTRAQVEEFVMYYERITRQMSKDLPRQANLTIFLDKDHHVIPPPDRRSFEG